MKIEIGDVVLATPSGPLARPSGIGYVRNIWPIYNAYAIAEDHSRADHVAIDVHLFHSSGATYLITPEKCELTLLYRHAETPLQQGDIVRFTGELPITHTAGIIANDELYAENGFGRETPSRLVQLGPHRLLIAVEELVLLYRPI